MPSPAEPVRVALVGLGGVGRAFCTLLAQRPGLVTLVAAADSRSARIDPDGLDPVAVLAAKAAGPVGDGPLELPAMLQFGRPDVVVDLAACGPDHEPTRSVLRAALRAGLPCVTANKAPIADEFAEWERLAGPGLPAIGITAATGAALPAGPLARRFGPTGDVEEIEAVLTGTTTHVLDAMAAGLSMEDAIRRAQEAGIAEPDPTADVSGADTAVKLVLLANTLWPVVLATADVATAGVEAVAREDLAGPGVVRIVGRARRRPDGRVTASVGPARLSAEHPLAVLRGSEKGIVLSGPAIGRVVVTGGRSSPAGAAAAALGDVLALAGAKVPEPAGA